MAHQEAANEPRMPGNIYILWRDLVKNYVNCSFTKVEDKLIAFAGIAKVFYNATGDTYIAGLWSSRAREGLDWRLHTPEKRRSITYRAPSWSWASVDGPVTLELSTATSVYLIEVIEYHILRRGSDPMDAVVSGQLLIGARLMTVQSISVSMNGDCTLNINLCPTSAKLMVDYLDTDVQTFDSRDVYFFPLHSFLSRNQRRPLPQVMCIWVEPLLELDERRLRRVGHFILQGYECLKQLDLLPNDDGVMVINANKSLEQIVVI
jgi:hypothetical protein